MTTRVLYILALVFSLIWQTPEANAAASQQNDITRATLLSNTLAIKPGEPFKLGVLLEPKSGWHSYWENPGDAGIPTSFSWTLPSGFTASNIEWPVPERINEGPLTIYGYHNKVFLPVTITPPKDIASLGVYEFTVKAEWLICEEICIPESALLSISLPMGEAVPSMHASLFNEHAKASPIFIDKDHSFTHDTGSITLEIPYEILGVTHVKTAQFFIRQPNVIRYPAVQKVSNGDATAFISIEASPTLPPNSISGLLTIEDNTKGIQTFDVHFANATPAPSPLTAPESSAASPQNTFFPVLLLFAVLGGLILNLMPCVLPVISLKALALLKKSGSEQAEARKHGIAYTAGILISFAAFAGLLISLQQAGNAVGWGYQMQSPAFVGFLIYLLLLVGLNLSGLFELPVLLGNTGASLANESSSRGSFFTGMLATAVATPCTAPFMASAVGVALTLPTWQALLIFEALGLGLALPFLFVSFFPALLRFLPKPGAWMESFKQFLAFPMYASVIWLLWVLTLQTGASGAVLALSGMLMMVVAIWMRRLFANDKLYQVLALGTFMGVLLFTLPMLNQMDGAGMMPPETGETNTVPYSPATLSKLQSEGKAVFVDATAAWCITCQLNAKTAIHTDRVMQVFKERSITLMIADWTRRNEEISNFLKSFGYQGVPLYVYYPPNGGKPVVLPQLLTPDIIIKTIEGAQP